MSNKYKSEVIEVYEQEGKAAVRFSFRGRERVECVKLYQGPDAAKLAIGAHGWMTFHLTASMGVWGFSPFKASKRG